VVNGPLIMILCCLPFISVVLSSVFEAEFVEVALIGQLLLDPWTAGLLAHPCPPTLYKIK